MRWCVVLDKPDMNVVCADKLLELAIKASTILEWGSGGSTVFMSKNVGSSTTIYSYEHNKVFYNLVSPSLKDNVYYYLVSEGEYVSAPKNIHYSIILVDGIKRKECLERARLKMSWDVLLLHDAERERYWPWMDDFVDDRYKKLFVKNLWMCETIK